MIDAETINCWKLNYGLDNRTPADAMRWWHDNDNGRAPAGAVAALGLCLDEIEALKATISRLLRYAYHEEECAVVASHYRHTPPCDCGYDELMAELEESKCKKY